MIVKIFFIFSLLAVTLFANKVIYFSYEEVPQRVIKGQIFDVTLKTLSTVKDFQDIKYEFTNHNGLEILQEEPNREKKGKFYYDTFKFCATSSRAKLPDINASLISENEYDASQITGAPLNVISLNPQTDFSNIIADDFSLINFKTTTYDNKSNIVVFTAKAENSLIEDIYFKNVMKQGIESVESSVYESRITYFVVIDKRYETFSFSYFNLLHNKFLDIEIPIIVDDDSVVTQTDLKPQDQSHEKIKLYITIAIASLMFLFIVYKGKYIYLILVLIPLGYITYILVPQKDVCIKANSAIQLLPVDNGTVFEITQTKITLPKEGSAKDYVKVRLENEKIGWVKYENTCKN